MIQRQKILHLLSLAFWFGMVWFFSFVVALSLFNTFEGLGKTAPDQRPAWFPLPAPYARIDPILDGPREQGSRAAGYAVGPLFTWYYLLQGICGLVAVSSALAWARSFPEKKVHRRRVWILMLALATVVIGWPIEKKVSDLREPRNRATDLYLQTPSPTPEVLQAMQSARADFGLWHTVSLGLNLATVILVTSALVLAAWLPETHERPHAV